MRGSQWQRAVVAMVLACGLVAPASGLVMDTVPVDNINNPADTSAHSGNPAGQGSVSYTYNIGKYEVTAGQYTEFLNKVAVTDTYGLYNTYMDTSVYFYGCNIRRTGASGSYIYSVAPDWANRPVNFVSFGDSCRFANWLHNGQPSGVQSAATTEDGAYALSGATSDAALLAVTRKASSWKWAVTSEDEWYKAAYYDPNYGGPGVPGYWLYPTSSNNVPGRDMSETTNPGNNANYSADADLIGSPYYRTPVGEFELSDSPYGTFDQGGNVWEWNEAVISSSYRGLRGGSFYDVYYGGLQSSSRNYIFPTDEYDSVGFRVSQVPEPASMALLALAGIGMLRRRGARG